MSKKRNLIMLILIGFFLCAFVIGTFFDYQINSEIFSKNNTFGLTISVLEPVISYGIIAFIGGGMIVFGLNKEFKTWMRVLFFVAVAACYGCSVFFAGNEFFGANGFTNKSLMWLGYVMMVPVMAGISFFGYKVTSKSENKNLWLIYLILLAAFVIAIVPGTTLIKVIFHRPRFRSVIGSEVEYYAWYQPCTDYEMQMKTYVLESEEFKSFPSGHSTRAIGLCLFAMFLPYIDNKYEKLVLPLFVGGLAWALLVMFARMLVGAHYLSDVSMGGIITTACMLIASYVLSNIKKLNV